MKVLVPLSTYQKYTFPFPSLESPFFGKKLFSTSSIKSTMRPR